MSALLDKLEIEYWRSLRKQAPDEEYATQYKAFEIGLSFRGLSKNQQRDFDFFLSDARNQKCHPNHFCGKSSLRYKPSSTEEWYWLFDTHGFAKRKELTQPNIPDCEGIKQSKETVNLTVRMWVESCFEMPFAFDFAACKESYPMEWPWKAFSSQLKKKYMEVNGFVTKFIAKNLAQNEPH